MSETIKYDKDKYDCHKKEVCDNFGTFKPKHTNAIILCLLEEILEKLNNHTCCSKCCNHESDDHENSSQVVNETIIQTGLVNNNVNVEKIVENATKKSK